ncbi:Crp/Fnr family transcriptional regulator [Myxococcota bacterium]|nr:Crp/Fnr family transcriptional regulator [Myxococcota bacterium]
MTLVSLRTLNAVGEGGPRPPRTSPPGRAPQRCPVAAGGSTLRGSCEDCDGGPAPPPLPRGSLVYLEGTSADEVVVALSGILREVRTTEDGRVQPVRLVIPGRLAGLEALTRPQYQTTLEVVTPARVCRVPVGELKVRLAANPASQALILDELMTALESMRTSLLWVGALSAEQRVLAFLRALVPPAVFTDVPLSRAEIGECLGLASETVSRCLGQLERSGQLEREGRRIRVTAAEPRTPDGVVPLIGAKRQP